MIKAPWPLILAHERSKVKVLPGPGTSSPVLGSLAYQDPLKMSFLAVANFSSYFGNIQPAERWLSHVLLDEDTTRYFHLFSHENSFAEAYALYCFVYSVSKVMEACYHCNFEYLLFLFEANDSCFVTLIISTNHIAWRKCCSSFRPVVISDWFRTCFRVAGL